ncbi:MAG: GGDEF domain-containing protein, partial [Acidobacteriota bacterium]
ISRVQEKFDARNAGAGRKCPLSISQGIACYNPEAPCSAQDLVNLADKRMYDRKTASKAGRTEAGPRPAGRPGGDMAPDVIP